MAVIVTTYLRRKERHEKRSSLRQGEWLKIRYCNRQKQLSKIINLGLSTLLANKSI